MQSVAAWLVSRPQNGSLGLFVTLLLPFSQIFSGAVLVLLLLHNSIATCFFQVLLAIVGYFFLGIITDVTITEIFLNIIVSWVPISLYAIVLNHTQSLALTLQISVIIAVLAILGFFIVLGDPIPYWNEVIRNVSNIFENSGFVQQSEILQLQQDALAAQMTILVVLITWSIYSLVLVLGNAAKNSLSNDKKLHDRFCDLNLGRVLATLAAIVSLLIFFTNSAWLQNIAVIAFMVFWLQGLSILHWFYENNSIPLMLLIVLYIMIPLLNAIAIILFALIGYTDAWFNYRSRIKKR